MLKLSIVIPTYNRASLLFLTLENITQQCKSLQTENSVEVIVSDNASNDDTYKVVKELEAKLDWEVQYYRNDENIDDLNFILSCGKTKGEFIWLFADDDLMEEGALMHVINNLTTGIHLYICNYSIWDDIFKKKIKEFRYPYLSDMLLKNREDVLSKFGIGLQFISCNIFHRTLFERLNYSRCMLLRRDNNMHLYMLYAGLTTSSVIKYLSKPIVQYRGNLANPPAPEIWNRIFIYSNFKFLKLLSLEKYSFYSRYVAADMIIKTYFISNLISSRIRGYSRQETIKNVSYELFLYPRFIFICLPILLIPNNMLIRLKSLYFKIKQSKNIYY